MQNNPETFHKKLLQFCVKVIEIDFTHWWRNLKSSKYPPLIREITDIDNIDAFILSLELCLNKKDFTLENIMLKLLSMISVCISFNENRKCLSLRNKDSRRYELTNKLCYILESKASLKEMVFYASLIRPSWLSGQLIIQRLLSENICATKDPRNIVLQFKNILKDVIPDPLETFKLLGLFLTLTISIYYFYIF